ncbi:MAG: hypothetical protein KDK70_37625 [Myxococcales bacterium]|nr:hypothetical protein [Myxococcales bacterium]
MRSLLLLLGLGLLLLAGGTAALWVVQNADQLVVLRLDLGRAVGAWQLAEPVTAPALVLGSFASGLVLALVPLGLWGLAWRGRARALERELELTSERR